ncbi:MAG: hypothetical protein ACE5GV_13930 [Candidatus Scalindua sp.]
MTEIAMPSTISGYASEIAGFVAQQWENSFEILQKSDALGFVAKGTIQQLDETFEECSSAGWDGERAKPISEEVLQCTKAFLKSFPLGIEAPEVGAEPDGAITLEWYRSPNRVISISINPGGSLYYAAIIGATRRHGMDFASFDVSDDLLGLISEVTRKIG